MARATRKSPRKTLPRPPGAKRPDAVLATFLAGAEAWAEAVELTDLAAESGFFFLAERRGAAARGDWSAR